MLNGCFVSYLLLMFVSVIHSQTNTTRCFPQYDGSYQCYIRPPFNLSWSDAQQWCKNNGATLPILKNGGYYGHDFGVMLNQYEYALRAFGLANQPAWISIKSTQDPNSWKWIDGSSYSGTVETGGNVNNSYAYMIRSGANISFGADPPFERNVIPFPPYNCDGVACSYTENCLWKNGRCYQKSSWRKTWYEMLYYGQLIVFTVKDLSDIEDWFDESTKYWIGLRCHSWYWQDPATNEATELTPSEISEITIDATYEQCVAQQNVMHKLTKHCSTRLPFICQTQRNVTQITTTRDTTSRVRADSTTRQRPITSRTRVESKARNIISETRAETTTATKTTNRPIGRSTFITSTVAVAKGISTSPTETTAVLKIDLLIGLGGCLFFLLIIWLSILTALYLRLYRRYMIGLHGHWSFKESSVKFIFGEDKFPPGEGASNDAVELQDNFECSKSNDKYCMNKPILQQA